MCSIWGFSLAENSKVNSRELTHALAGEGEARGTDASGWAYSTRNGYSGMHKDAGKGSQLSLKGLPRRADAVIGHNRMATQGTFRLNENNHPQVSPEGKITLVHNGHISNDFELRKMLTGGKSLAEVDTSVIPATIEEFGTEGTGLLAGYAAVAWLDTRTGNTVHLARLDTSPVAIARLLDGSIVFASTDRILARALQRCGIKWVGSYPNTFMELSDGDYITITDGVITMRDKLEWYDDYRYSYYGGTSTWRTAGAASQMGQPPISGRAEFDAKPQYELGGASDRKTGRSHYVRGERGIYEAFPTYYNALGIEGYFDGYNNWQVVPPVGTDGEFSAETGFDENGYWRDNTLKNVIDRVMSTDEPVGDGFYILDHDGDFQSFVSPFALASYLSFTGEQAHEAVLTEDREIAWINSVLDLGQIDDQGSFISWVHEPDLIDAFDTETLNLSFVRNGVSILSNVMVS